MSRKPGGSYSTVMGLLAARAAMQADAPAIASIAGTVLTFGRLVSEIRQARAALRTLGIGPRDRIATVLPDGPEAALAFLSVASSCVSAPLNPALRATKLRFYLQDIPARAVLVQAGAGGEIVDVARALGIQIIELVPRGDGAGTFDLRCDRPGVSVPDVGDALPGSIALVLHTSGTTSQPKLVPLTHENLAASAQFTATALELGPADRALHVVPMFHIQGLLTSLLAPLAAGGAVVCAPGFQPDNFIQWLQASRATWYTAVPTMHQAIVERARPLGPSGGKGRLRFVRSSASPLSASLADELRDTFGVPVVNGYGMTEAAPIITSTPLAPGRSKPGSVGIPAGPEVAILDEHGRGLGPGTVGEIAVRGANVMGDTNTTPRRTRRRSSTGGSAPAIRGISTRTAISSSPDASRRSSTAAARRSPRARSRKSCCSTRPSPRPWSSGCPTPGWARRWRRLSFAGRAQA